MTQIAGQGTVWNLPNYWGDLFTADMISTPFLTAIGGLNEGGLETDNFEFATSVEYDFRAAAQPVITETGSLTAPTANEGVRNQKLNVAQIFQESIKLSYTKLSNKGRLSGINTQGKQNNVIDELAWQIAYNLQTIARDVEYTFLNGAYQKSTDAAVANKTRGMLALCELSGSTSLDASAALLTKDMIDYVLRTMGDNGAVFSEMVIWANGFQKQQISRIYGYAPDDRNVGGVNIKQIETDYGLIGIALPHRFMPADDILFAEMSVVKPVTQPVPEKGNMFYEALAKVGASENGQLYGQVGLAHGPAYMHGKIHSLKTS